ncbi:DNA-binding CsgD family transcriptional regulator/sugar-specific transcriptional regulator TrmB [Catenulispora sp. GP43]
MCKITLGLTGEEAFLMTEIPTTTSAGLGLLGLGDDSASVYQEMLRAPADSATGIAHRLGWDEPRTLAALAELERLELVRPSWQTPGALRAVEPGVGLAALLSRQEAELQRRREAVEAGRLVVQDVVTQFSDTRQWVNVEVLTGLDAIRLRIQSLAAECRTELAGMAPGGPQSAATMAASKPLDQALLERGLQMRSLYLDSIVNDPANLEYIRWLAKAGGNVRTTATLPFRMQIYDRRLAVVPVDPNTPGSGALLVRSPSLVSALCALFDHAWTTAQPFGERPEPSDQELTAQELAVLRLLAQGHADESIARRLGVSVRTSRRITAALMTHLNASSRFQAGAMAALRGLINADDLV